MQEALKRYFDYLAYLKDREWPKSVSFMEDKIKAFCEKNSETLFNLAEEDVDEVIDGVLQELCKGKQDNNSSSLKDDNEIVDNEHNAVNTLEKSNTLKEQIAKLINQHLGKTDQKNYKKLFWDRKGEGCKDGKLLNTRCFLKSKSGYINKINDEWNMLLDDNKISYTDKLESLKTFVKKLNEKDTSGCCPF